jgi:poly-gamma-glutamate synthesis protein (capsule biosynthesis protein)
MRVSSLTFVAVGDCIISRRCSHRKEPGFLDLVEKIRKADVAHANLEIMIPKPPFIPSSEYGGMHLSAPAFVLDELKWIGFNIYNIANNHSADYTFHGLLDTIDALEERDMVYAGGGANLGEARSPAYIETDVGRIAIIGAASSFVTGAHAAAARPDMPGRPGLNPLRIDRDFVLTAQQIAWLTEIDKALGTAAVTERRRQFGLFPEWKEGALKFMGLDFFTGDIPAFRQKAKKEDVDEICHWIRDARRQADFVVMSLHAHHGINGDGNNPEMAEFLPEVAHAFIDAGADAFVGHGPHMLRPIEIYKGKPVFYSLGNFIFALEGIRRYPSEMYERHKFGPDATPADVADAWTKDKEGRPHGFPADRRFYETVLPVCRFEDGVLAEMQLHPLSLRHEAARTRRGEPVLACATAGREILERLAEASAPFGLKIRIEPDGERVVGCTSW